MPYWGDSADECDYAFDAIGAYVILIRDRMTTDMATVIQQAYPEQGITASVACLRLLGERFPKCLDVSFRRKDFERAKEGFSEWYGLVRDKLPPERRDGIAAEAKKEFELFEERILRR
jgi:hypothetical protein